MPAMEAGIVDELWTIQDLLRVAERAIYETDKCLIRSKQETCYIGGRAVNASARWRDALTILVVALGCYVDHGRFIVFRLTAHMC